MHVIQRDFYCPQQTRVTIDAKCLINVKIVSLYHYSKATFQTIIQYN